MSQAALALTRVSFPDGMPRKQTACFRPCYLLSPLLSLHAQRAKSGYVSAVAPYCGVADCGFTFAR